MSTRITRSGIVKVTLGIVAIVAASGIIRKSGGLLAKATTRALMDGMGTRVENPARPGHT